MQEMQLQVEKYNKLVSFVSQICPNHPFSEEPLPIP